MFLKLTHIIKYLIFEKYFQFKRLLEFEYKIKIISITHNV